MNQSANFLCNLLFVEWTTLVTFGLCLLALRKHEKSTYYIYTRSRYLLGTNFLIFSLEPFFYWLDETGIYNVPHTEIIALSLYIVAEVLLSMTYIPFVQPDYINRRRIIYDTALIVLSLILLYTGIIAGGIFGFVSRIVVTMLLFVAIYLFGLRFYSYYRQAQQKIDNFYADDFRQSIAWLSRSVTLIIILGLTICLTPFFPHWLVTIHKILCFFSAIYMFLSFINYMLNTDFIALTIGLPQENGRLNRSTILQLQRRTKRWQETSAALTKNITINDVSRQLGTNRTYLSLYLNTYLNTSFKEWIGSIRLKHAKMMLASNTQTNMEQLADATGFTSASAFSHYFKAHEGLSPKQWRRQNEYRATGQNSGKEEAQ